MKISIIIPAFNVAEYLESCIKSCLNQSMAIDEYEIILVDDGSQDNGPAIGRKYAADNANIIFYRQDHAGQSVARNKGLEMARGEYIWFVDADDKIRANVLNHLYVAASSDNLDMLAFRGAEIIDGKAIQITKHNQLAQGIVPGRNYLFYDYSVCVPFYIFRKVFLDATGLRFMEGVFHEDEEFMLRALYQCRLLGFLDKVQYEVTIRQGSITRSINPKKAYDLISVSESLSQYVNNKVEPAYKQVFHNRISMLLNSVLQNAARMDKQELSVFLPFLYLHNTLFRHMRKSNNIKYRLEGVVFLSFAPVYSGHV
jgi:glycosyltransferase involved in cell wall biosynthesis